MTQCPAGRSRAATIFFRIFMAGPTSLGYVLFVPSPRAIRVRWRSRTIFRNPCGSSENAWSVPFIARLRVKCFSITRAPRT